MADSPTETDVPYYTRKFVVKAVDRFEVIKAEAVAGKPIAVAVISLNLIMAAMAH